MCILYRYMTNLKKIIIVLIIFVVSLIFTFIYKVINLNEDLNKLPHTEVVLPDGFKAGGILYAGQDNLFLVHAIKILDKNNWENKIFLVSQKGTVLDEFQGSKHMSYINNFERKGIIVSSYSNYLGEDKHFTILIKNNKIILNKTSNEKLDIFSLPTVKNVPFSENVKHKYKCYLTVDIENGTCTYGITTLSMNDKHISSSKFKIANSTAINKDQTAILLKPNDSSQTLKVIILGPDNK